MSRPAPRACLWGLVLLGLGLGLGGCPKVRPLLQHEVPDRVLLKEAQLLVAQLKQARLGAPSRLVEAWLAHYRGRSEERDRALCTWLDRTGLGATAAAAKLSALPGEGPRPGRLRFFLGAVMRARPKRCQALREQAYRPRKGQRILPGFYSFTETRTGQQGDSLTVAERWILRPKLGSAKGTLSGLYLRRLERVSGDGRHYLCNKSTRYSVLMVFTVELRRRRGQLIIEETEAYVRPDACAPKRVRLDRCAALLRAGGMLLRCPEERQLTRLGGLDLLTKTRVYRQTRSATRSDGARQQISEDWHLALWPPATKTKTTPRPTGSPIEAMQTVEGFVFRNIHTLAHRPKTFSCNGKSSHQLKRLVLLAGQLGADGQLSLTAQAALHRPHPCERGRDTLGRYQGHLTDRELTLSGDGGNQLLKIAPAEPSWALPLSKFAK